MMDDLTSQKQITYFFPGGDSVTIPNPLGAKISARDGRIYHIVSTLSGSSLVIAPHWLAIEMVPSTEKATIH